MKRISLSEEEMSACPSDGLSPEEQKARDLVIDLTGALRELGRSATNRLTGYDWTRVNAVIERADAYIAERNPLSKKLRGEL